MHDRSLRFVFVVVGFFCRSALYPHVSATDIEAICVERRQVVDTMASIAVSSSRDGGISDLDAV
jgi:hypothetical protein